MSSSYLFPRRQSRREFLATTSAAALAGSLATGTSLVAAEQAVTLGSGRYAFTLDSAWGKLPAGMNYGFGCAVVVDGLNRVIVTSRSQNPCVAIFSPQGELLETWSKDFSDKIGLENPGQVTATAHGLYWSKEPEGEFLYWTENVAGGPNGMKLGARVYKTDMQGKVLYTLGNVATASDTSQPFTEIEVNGKKTPCFTNPTDVAVAPNGDIYIVDGYGSQFVHRFDKSFKHLQSIGGRGAKGQEREHGKFNTCHGVWVSTLRKEPEVWIADRAHNRIEIFSLDLTYLRTIEGVRQPCCFYQHGGLMYVPELGARVSIIDESDKIVASLGDGTGAKKEQAAEHPDKFFTPHALTLDSRGNLYVIEWLPSGRPRKFAPTPA
jgi:hypothetical protein